MTYKHVLTEAEMQEKVEPSGTPSLISGGTANCFFLNFKLTYKIFTINIT